MEADMYNLYPAVGELNADRNNFRYGIIDGEERTAIKLIVEAK